jgi:hypothetical protein
MSKTLLTIALCMCSLSLGLTLGRWMTVANLQIDAIEHDVAQYNPKNGEFEFKRCGPPPAMILPN